MATATDELSGLGDRSLRSRIKKARKDFSRLHDTGPETEETLAGMRAAGDIMEAGERELRRREQRAIINYAPQRRALRNELDARAARKQETAAALRALNMIAPPPGAKASRLSQEQGEELLTLVLKSRKEEISAAEQERWEELAETASASPGFYERGRREQELAAKAAQVAEQERLASLPQRGAPPPGSIMLPGYLTQWLLEARDDGLTYARLGVLAGALLGLENHAGTLVGSRYADGALVGASPPFRFDGQDGSPEVGDALTYLAMSGLLAIERGGPQGTSIRLGPRLEKFYEEAEKGGE